MSGSNGEERPVAPSTAPGAAFDPGPHEGPPQGSQAATLEPPGPGIVYTTPPARASRIPEAPPAPLPPRVSLSIDGVEVSVPAGSTILEACRAQGLDIPTLCYLENLTPVNVCRVCVVEVKGARVLAPAPAPDGRHGGIEARRHEGRDGGAGGK